MYQSVTMHVNHTIEYSLTVSFLQYLATCIKTENAKPDKHAFIPT